jgi:hypothetical protein
MPQIKMLAHLPNIITEAFRGFIHSLQANYKILAQITPRTLLSTALPFNYSLITQQFNAIYMELPAESLHELQAIFS